jgi:Amt family ammonium transporter
MGTLSMRLSTLSIGLMASGLAAAEDTLNAANTSWILTSTALVLFMTLPGLALFYGGLVRSKNVLSILMQCFAITCIASVLWFVVGYSIAFGEGNPYFGGMGKALLSGVTSSSLAGDIPETVFVMFQMTFAIITPALIIGGFAERIKFSAVVIFTALWLLVVYAPITHWVWGGGWLGEMGLLDFAGGTVVHITAGVAALVSAVVLGNRKGFGETAMPPHNMTMTIMGAGMLWVGWFGFNAGSALAANGDAGMAMLVTHLSAAAGTFTWLTIEWIKYGKPSALGAVTGMVAGLGTITPASGYVGPGGALVIGLSALYQTGVENRRFAGCVSGTRCWRHIGDFFSGNICQRGAWHIQRSRLARRCHYSTAAGCSINWDCCYLCLRWRGNVHHISRC